MGGLWLALTGLTRSALEEDEAASVQGVASITVPLVLGLADDPSELSQGLSQAQVSGNLQALQVLDSQGETMAPRSGMPALILLGPERLDALLSHVPVSQRVDTPRGGFFVHARALPGGGFLFLARSSRDFDNRLDHINRVVLVWALGLLLAASLVAAILVRMVVTKPIDRLLAKAGSIATGNDTDASLSEESDEFGVLRKSLRDMAAKINKDRFQMLHHAEELQKINQELTQAQDQIIRTEKLASVGQLAAGMAHEIGNPIGIILGYTEMLENPSLPEPRRLEVLAQIRKAIDRIDTTIKDILNYSRPAEDESMDAYPHVEVQSVLDLLRPQKRFRNVTVLFNDQLPSSATASIPPSRLKQVLLNMFLNAADAMKGEGTLSVDLHLEQDQVVIDISDTGPGIPEELAYRIFDPFFTTKEVGKGTGLGLFVCQTVVTNYKGTIAVDGRPGKGAQFTISLPAGHTGVAPSLTSPQKEASR